MRATFVFSIITLFVFCPAYGQTQNLTATQIVKKADDLQRGETNQSIISVKIIRPKWTRTVEIKNRSKGSDYSLTYVISPPKDKGQVFLKRKNEMWNWVPSVGRMIKLPPSMMSQGWMGSDYTFDDILKESSIVKDYNHKITGKKDVSGIMCYVIEMIPKEDAAVTWGKVIKYISVKEFWQMKNKYYDEDGELIKTEIASKIKTFGDRRLPSFIEIIPADKPGHKTEITIKSSKFNIKTDESYFSIQNMKKIR